MAQLSVFCLFCMRLCLFLLTGSCFYKILRALFLPSRPASTAAFASRKPFPILSLHSWFEKKKKKTELVFLTVFCKDSRWVCSYRCGAAEPDNGANESCCFSFLCHVCFALFCNRNHRLHACRRRLLHQHHQCRMSRSVSQICQCHSMNLFCFFFDSLRNLFKQKENAPDLTNILNFYPPSDV
jgi:hypothetical protein